MEPGQHGVSCRGSVAGFWLLASCPPSFAWAKGPLPPTEGIQQA